MSNEYGFVNIAGSSLDTMVSESPSQRKVLLVGDDYASKLTDGQEDTFSFEKGTVQDHNYLVNHESLYALLVAINRFATVDIIDSGNQVKESIRKNNYLFHICSVLDKIPSLDEYSLDLPEVCINHVLKLPLEIASLTGSANNTIIYGSESRKDFAQPVQQHGFDYLLSTANPQDLMENVYLRFLQQSREEFQMNHRP